MLKQHIAAYKTTWNVIISWLPPNKCQYFFVTIDRKRILPLPHVTQIWQISVIYMELWRKIRSTKHHIAAYKTAWDVITTLLPSNKCLKFLCHDRPIKGFTPTPTVTQNRQISTILLNFDAMIRSTKHHIAAYKTTWNVITSWLPTNKCQYFFVTIDR